jgi:hypothetical protein
MGKDKETKIDAPCSEMAVCFSFEVGRSMFIFRKRIKSGAF